MKTPKEWADQLNALGQSADDRMYYEAWLDLMSVVMQKVMIHQDNRGLFLALNKAERDWENLCDLLTFKRVKRDGLVLLLKNKMPEVYQEWKHGEGVAFLGQTLE